jgi:hypothetical protein
MPLETTLLINSIDVLTVSGTNRYGVPLTTSTATNVVARASFMNTRVIDPTGNEVVSNISFKIRPPRDWDVNAGDIVTYDSKSYRLLEVRKPSDDHGVHHYTLLGKTTTEV